MHHYLLMVTSCASTRLLTQILTVYTSKSSTFYYSKSPVEVTPKEVDMSADEFFDKAGEIACIQPTVQLCLTYSSSWQRRTSVLLSSDRITKDTQSTAGLLMSAATHT